MIALNGAIEGKKRMTYPELGRYFTALTNDKIDRVAADSEVSRATIYSIRSGRRGRPEKYERLALAIGKTRLEQREIYKTLMRLSGFLDLLPDEDSAIDTSLDALVLAEIKRRYSALYDDVAALVAARLRGGRGDTTREENQKGSVEQGQ
jgi:hypothetical protein